jgi:hypothetical protein
MTRRGKAAVVVLLCMTTGVGCSNSPAPARKVPEATKTTFATPTTTQNPATSVKDMPVGSPVVDEVVDLLPAGTKLRYARDVDSNARRDGASYIDLSTVRDATGFEISIYRQFDSAELDEWIGNPETTDDGSWWVPDPTGRSRAIYFLSADGVGLFIRHLAKPPLSESDLRLLALHIAELPSTKALTAGR